MSSQDNGVVGSLVEEMGRGKHTSFFQHLIAGSCAGIAEHLCMYPVDVVKTRIFAGRAVNRFSRAMIDTFRKEGWKIFRGMHIAVLGAIPSHAILFATYERVLNSRVLEKYSLTAKSGISGIVATMSHDLIANIFGVIKTRIMLRTKLAGTLSGFNLFKRIIIDEGVTAFFVSYPFAVLMNIPYVLAYFSSYEFLRKKLCSKYGNKEYLYLVAGAIAGALAGYVSTPFDLIKVNLMRKNKGILRVLPHLYKRHGFLGFFRGASTRAFYYLPSGAITWFTYEMIVKLFYESNQRKILEKDTEL